MSKDVSRSKYKTEKILIIFDRYHIIVENWMLECWERHDQESLWQFLKNKKGINVHMHQAIFQFSNFPIFQFCLQTKKSILNGVDIRTPPPIFWIYTKLQIKASFGGRSIITINKFTTTIQKYQNQLDKWKWGFGH